MAIVLYLVVCFLVGVVIGYWMKAHKIESQIEDAYKLGREHATDHKDLLVRAAVRLAYQKGRETERKRHE